MALFPHFARRKVKASGATINLVTGGQGPPVLLLHGYPETHAMWHKVAPTLAHDYTVVCADLRGYGDSSKPKARRDHSSYSKRAMAKDMVEVMQALGHERFHVVGHDRGARVAHRLARDHGPRVLSLTVMDISPTLTMYEGTTQAFATAYYHWFLLIQPAPLPEKMLAALGPLYVLKRLGRSAGGLRHFPTAVRREYLRAWDEGAIHGSCEDYRAAATIDLEHDRADLRRKIRMPVLVLWGKHGVIERLFKPIEDWQEISTDVRGRALDCGHFLPEERPVEVLRELRRFLKNI
jgi:haloacetate dehalogenase